MVSKPENRPLLEFRLVVVVRPHDGSAVARIQVQTRHAEWASLRSQEWPSGRPTPTQLELLAADMTDQVQAAVVTFVGVQGAFV